MLPNLDDLNLRDNDLAGRIPDLSSLDTLTRLRLHNNMLSGEIPATLGDLDSLQSLWLSENKLSGEIPAALGILSYYNLVRLRLAGNQFTGCLPAQLRDVADKRPRRSRSAGLRAGRVRATSGRALHPSGRDM